MPNSGAEQGTPSGDKTPLCKKCQKRPVEYRRVGLCRFCHSANMRAAKKKLKRPSKATGATLMATMHVVIPFVRGKTTVTAKELRKRFGWSFARAYLVMHELERLGHIGPARGTLPREVLMSPAKKGKAEAQPAPVRHARRRQRARTDLIESARKLFFEKGRATLTMVIEELQVPRLTAQAIMRALQKQGIIRPTKGKLRRHWVLLTATKAIPRPAGGGSRKPKPFEEKRRVIEGMIAASDLLGASDKAVVLRDILGDLEELEKLRKAAEIFRDAIDR